MYIIKLNNKKPTRKALTGTFKTYDEAKNAIRRLFAGSANIALSTFL